MKPVIEERRSVDADLLFPLEEFRARLAAVRAQMATRGVDLLIVDETEILHYLTGYTISQNVWRCCLVPLQGEPVMVLRQLDVSPFLERSWLRRYCGYVDWLDSVEIVSGLIRDEGWSGGTIGFDPDSYCMSVGRFEHLRTTLPQATFEPFAGVLRELRIRKSSNEIAYMRRAAAVADGAMKVAADAAIVGASERDVAAAASAAFVRLGADNGRIGPLTRSRQGWGFLHGHLHDKPLHAGDVLHFEPVPTVQGYGARLMRPIVVGRASDELREAARLLVDIQDRQIAAMRPGAIGREVDAITRNGLVEAGLRESYGNPTGYTLGFFHFSSLRTSDFTRVLHPTADWIFVPGMVFHVYASAKGVAFSETVLVTEAGPERLTQLERVLIER